MHPAFQARGTQEYLLPQLPLAKMTTSGNVNNDRFNAEAAAWDSNPDVHRASDLALEALLKQVEGLEKNGSKLMELI